MGWCTEGTLKVVVPFGFPSTKPGLSKKKAHGNKTVRRGIKNFRKGHTYLKRVRESERERERERVGPAPS